MKNKIVICIDNADYPAALEKFKLYSNIPDPKAEQQNMIRVVDESGEDYLYPTTLFQPLSIPENIESLILNEFNLRTK
jgi:hypothetical protein